MRTAERFKSFGKSIKEVVDIIVSTIKPKRETRDGETRAREAIERETREREAREREARERGRFGYCPGNKRTD